MTRAFKCDLLLTYSLALIYYCFLLASSYYPGPGASALGLVKSLHMNPSSLLLFIGLLLWALPCMVVACYRAKAEADRFMLFWSATLALFFLSPKSLRPREVPASLAALLLILALPLVLGWVLYIRSSRPVAETGKILPGG
jgi:hypothetical protein